MKYLVTCLGTEVLCLDADAVLDLIGRLGGPQDTAGPVPYKFTPEASNDGDQNYLWQKVLQQVSRRDPKKLNSYERAAAIVSAIEGAGDKGIYNNDLSHVAGTHPATISRLMWFMKNHVGDIGKYIKKVGKMGRDGKIRGVKGKGIKYVATNKVPKLIEKLAAASNGTFELPSMT